eukprot:m.128236 g.128236  ORF g.128236 m.128236 type:complete len:728 (+) comp16387_c0_seq2:109-2292(+)
MYKSTSVDSPDSPPSPAAEKATESSTMLGSSRIPKAVGYIIGNEFCERFSYYGMRAILVLYFVKYLRFSDDAATVLYHVFILASYTTSAFGGMLADSKFGKYRTIFYLSIVYCIGNIVTSVTAIPGTTGSPPSWWGAAIGLMLIAIGTGGIKPCVSSFGGDQFTDPDPQLIQTYFTYFYFSINAGSTISMLVTPKLRGDVGCFDRDDCYPLAFGLPASLMLVALAIFVMGRHLYIHRICERNVMFDVCGVLWDSLKLKLRNFGRGGSSTGTMDLAGKRYGAQFVQDIRSLKGILLVFAPTPLFWTLYDQQGSRWTLQAEKMQMFSMGALGMFRPDMMQTLNAVLCLLMLPLFDRVIYPGLRRMRINATPLRRMGFGMILVALSFIISGLVQIKIESSSNVPVAPSGSFTGVKFLNACPQTASFTLNSSTQTLGVNGVSSAYTIVPSGTLSIGLSTGTDTHNVTVTLQPSSLATVACVRDSSNTTTLAVLSDVYSRGEAHSDKAVVRVFNAAFEFPTLQLHGDTDDGSIDVVVSLFNVSAYGDAPFSSGVRYLSIHSITPPADFSSRMELDDGGSYTLVVTSSNGNMQTFLINDVQSNQVSILWQVPQYVVITAAEILFSVTGLEFAFVEAPESMKAVMQAIWLLTTAVGSIIVIIVAEADPFSKQSTEFFAYSGFMGVVFLIFAFLASRYRYRSEHTEILALCNTAPPPREGPVSDTEPLLEESSSA